jgi:hypothetical protein
VEQILMQLNSVLQIPVVEVVQYLLLELSMDEVMAVADSDRQKLLAHV